MRIYIAGPITRGPLVQNVNRATAAFVALAKLGFAPMCPQWSVYSKPAFATPNRAEVLCFGTVNGNDEMTHADWLDVDLPWVGVADAVLRLPGESSGADRETAHAAAKGIPVFDDIADLVRWARERETCAVS